ncbi:pyridoxamine 5'-phosphate oxidase family protein [Amycolatopsis sp. QT-25]|uniref:pyridoxamine 5'-phosphate oxidase family protein n=1 Tax=Amycolatopsis sp. QT-25 TaxID=3034022 RepID=UPI0023ECB195|nr:pyridoxamine 5'-phosphate oxidase family protein [Amycolatopsis sp. QT-25]WET78146.1 pyridoxamine 5'-phosphate oxidase family protein [Amycolatopsis sp. QT-25]
MDLDEVHDENAGMPMSDSLGLEVLDREECLSLLAGAGLGRVVFTSRALPAVQPARFVLHHGAIVIRTPSQSALFAAILDSVVAFAVDEFSANLGAGWFVTVLGRASEVRDPIVIAELETLPLCCWTGQPDARYVRIPVESVTGRRILGGRGNEALSVIDAPDERSGRVRHPDPTARGVTPGR